MKIYEVVDQIERPDQDEESDFNDQIRYIEGHCAPYLKEVGGVVQALFRTPLFRGINYNQPDSNDPINIIKVDQARAPKDAPIDVHKMMDLWFVKKSNVPFRSSSLFCTGSWVTAGGYGDAVVVIPVGKYQYCWSPVYEDLYEDIGRAMVKIDRTMGMDRSLTTQYLVANPNALWKFLKNGNYQFNHGLREAIDSKHEVMLQCEQALVINLDWVKENF